ncbi:MAG TPA: c-type cytochrome [Bryobacteraceae bacterium]|jgi:mono/diheme cytochrome c family protein|nr:c-type cytochrome [Bryobacteraceae bacterium]
MSRRRVILGAVLLLPAGAVWTYWFVVHHSFSARVAPAQLEATVARNLRRLGTEPRFRDLKSPLHMTPLAIAETRDHFADHCAICHANDGSGKTAIGANMYPPAPDLRADATQGLSDGELMYIIKNGIRFTGMPGWGGEDEENWKLVLFIRHLRQLTAEERKLMNEVNQLDGESGERARPQSEPGHQKN